MAGNNKANMPKLLSMAAVEEKETSWLIPNIIPKKNITLICGDGGAGKTSLWCNIAAAVSAGNKSILDQRPEDSMSREPQKVLFFSSEDSIQCTLRKKLRLAGANLENIFSVDLSDPAFSHVQFGSRMLEDIISSVKPSLTVFDPLQSFIPPNLQMSQRNAMRSCLNPLVGLGEKYNCTFIIVVHTNKRQGCFGRNRVSDSSDIWDIARSVLILGATQEKKQHYISHEKCNYGELQETILFRIDNGKIVYDGYSEMKDRDYVAGQSVYVRPSPAREDAKGFIIDFLKNGKQPTKELNEAAQAAGFSQKTMERAKSDLRKEKQIAFSSSGYGSSKTFYTFLLAGS